MGSAVADFPAQEDSGFKHQDRGKVQNEACRY